MTIGDYGPDLHVSHRTGLLYKVLDRSELATDQSEYLGNNEALCYIPYSLLSDCLSLSQITDPHVVCYLSWV